MIALNFICCIEVLLLEACGDPTVDVPLGERGPRPRRVGFVVVRGGSLGAMHAGVSGTSCTRRFDILNESSLELSMLTS